MPIIIHHSSYCKIWVSSFQIVKSMINLLEDGFESMISQLKRVIGGYTKLKKKENDLRKAKSWAWNQKKWRMRRPKALAFGWRPCAPSDWFTASSVFFGVYFSFFFSSSGSGSSSSGGSSSSSISSSSSRIIIRANNRRWAMSHHRFWGHHITIIFLLFFVSSVRLYFFPHCCIIVIIVDSVFVE